MSFGKEKILFLIFVILHFSVFSPTRKMKTKIENCITAKKIEKLYR